MSDSLENRKKQLTGVATAIEEQIASEKRNEVREDEIIFTHNITREERAKINIGISQANAGLGISRDDARKAYERFL